MKKAMAITLAFFLVLACIPVTATAAPVFPDANPVSSAYMETVEDFELSKIKSLDHMNNEELISISADSVSDESCSAVSISFADSLAGAYSEAKVCITLPDNKEPVFLGNVTPETVSIYLAEVLWDTEYIITVTMEQEGIVHNFFGTLTICQKDGVVSPKLNLIHEVYQSMDLIDHALASRSDAVAAGIRYEVESNNTQALADVMYDDDTMYGCISSSSDTDYYKVRFSNNGNANFWLGDIPSGCDYDFYLYDQNGYNLASSTTTNNQEMILEYPVTAGKWYYMQVIGYRGDYDASASYRVRAKNYPAESSWDCYEINNTFSEATFIGNNTVISDANLHSDSDVDYYRISIPSASYVGVVLKAIPANCDYDLSIYDDAEEILDTSAKADNSNEGIYIDLEPGFYYIKIHSYAGSSNAYYRLSVETTVIPRYDITHYVDQGYRCRIPNTTTEVRGHQDIVSNLFKSIFGVNITSSVYLYTSLADTCKGTVTQSNLAAECILNGAAVTTNDLHTKLKGKISANADSLSLILWTGHILDGNPPSSSIFDNRTVVITPMAITYDNEYYDNKPASDVIWK